MYWLGSMLFYMLINIIFVFENHLYRIFYSQGNKSNEKKSLVLSICEYSQVDAQICIDRVPSAPHTEVSTSASVGWVTDARSPNTCELFVVQEVMFCLSGSSKGNKGPKIKLNEKNAT